MKPVLVVALLFGAVACGKKSGDEKTGGEPPVVRPVGGTAAGGSEGRAPATEYPPGVLPEAHYKELSPLFESIIGGDLAQAKQIAAALPRYESRNGIQKAAWSKHLAAVADAAGAGARADDLKEAAGALGTMLEQCDACHLLGGAEPFEIPRPQQPDKGDIKRHGWGAIKMLLGLVGNDLVGYSTGAQALETAPFYDDEIKKLLGEEELAAIPEIRKRAFEANEMLPNSKGEIFGEMIGYCAGCHTKLGEAHRAPGR